VFTGKVCGETGRRINSWNLARFGQGKSFDEPTRKLPRDAKRMGRRWQCGAPMSERLSLRIANDIKEIDRMGAELARWCQRVTLPAEVEYQIDLVLDEIVSNVIRHGLKDDKEHTIEIKVCREEHDLILEVEDDGIPFNPLDNPAPDITLPIAERRIGGLGILLVREFMDSLAYERREGKNYMFMKMRLAEDL
jgi:serine/threonine-protein kinase RsbW